MKTALEIIAELNRRQDERKEELRKRNATFLDNLYEELEKEFLSGKTELQIEFVIMKPYGSQLAYKSHLFTVWTPEEELKELIKDDLVKLGFAVNSQYNKLIILL